MNRLRRDDRNNVDTRRQVVEGKDGRAVGEGNSAKLTAFEVGEYGTAIGECGRDRDKYLVGSGIGRKTESKRRGGRKRADADNGGIGVGSVDMGSVGRDGIGVSGIGRLAEPERERVEHHGLDGLADDDGLGGIDFE